MHLTQVPFEDMWPFLIGVMSLLSPPQIVFEAVTSGQRGLLAIKDVVVQGHQCSKSFFSPLTIKEYHQTFTVPSMTLLNTCIIVLCKAPHSNKRPSKSLLQSIQSVNLPPASSLMIDEHTVDMLKCAQDLMLVWMC